MNMEEDDFLIRNELESLDPGYQQRSFEPPPIPMNLPTRASGPDGDYLRQLMQNAQQNQMQHQLNWLMSRSYAPESKQEKGLSLYVSQDILRWVLLFAFILILIWILLEVRKHKKIKVKKDKSLKRRSNPHEQEMTLDEMLGEE